MNIIYTMRKVTRKFLLAIVAYPQCDQSDASIFDDVISNCMCAESYGVDCRELPGLFVHRATLLL